MAREVASYMEYDKWCQGRGWCFNISLRYSLVNVLL
jgi:hypothetical protein